MTALDLKGEGARRARRKEDRWQCGAPVPRFHCTRLLLHSPARMREGLPEQDCKNSGFTGMSVGSS